MRARRRARIRVRQRPWRRPKMRHRSQFRSQLLWQPGMRPRPQPLPLRRKRDRKRRRCRSRQNGWDRPGIRLRESGTDRFGIRWRKTGKATGREGRKGRKHLRGMPWEYLPGPSRKRARTRPGENGRKRARRHLRGNLRRRPPQGSGKRRDKRGRPFLWSRAGPPFRLRQPGCGGCGKCAPAGRRRPGNWPGGRCRILRGWCSPA